MPKLKKKSYLMQTRDNKLKRKQREEHKKNLKKLQTIEAESSEESDVLSIRETETLRRDVGLEEARRTKRSEYARNYRKNMPEEKKIMARAVAAQKMALKRKNMCEEEKAAIRAADRLRMVIKRENMSEDEKRAYRKFHRQRMALKRQCMSEEEKMAEREANRHRVALKRRKSKEAADCFANAVLRMAMESQNLICSAKDLADSSSDDDVIEDVQRFLAVTLITGNSIVST